MSDSELGHAAGVQSEQMDQQALEEEVNNGLAPKDWSAADLAIKVLKTGSAGHSRLLSKMSARNARESFDHPSTMVYDAMALAYNRMNVDDVMVVNLPTRPSLGNLRLIIKGRGLGPQDYRLYKPLCDENGQRFARGQNPYILQRTSDKEMRFARKYPAEAAALSQKAEAVGQAFDILHAQPGSKPTPQEETVPAAVLQPEVPPVASPPTLGDIAPLGGGSAKAKNKARQEVERELVDIPPIAANN